MKQTHDWKLNVNIILETERIELIELKIKNLNICNGGINGFNMWITIKIILTDSA